MKRNIAFYSQAILSLVIFLSFLSGTRAVSAQSSSYSIQNVNHQIEIMYSGQIIIRDTIHVTGKLTGDFLIGFPKRYGAHVLKGVAYDTNSVFPMSLDVPFEGHSNLYGARISFQQVAPQVFTVIFILSNYLVHQNNSLNAVAVEFPAYPSLAKEVAKCNVNLVLPDFASGITVAKDDGSVTTNNYVKENLAAFIHSPAVVSFSMPTGILQVFSITNLDRVITVTHTGDVVASDSYRVVNNANDSLVAFGADVPLAASNIVGRDELGRNLVVETVGTGSTFHLVNVTLNLSLTKGQSTWLTVEYTLPKVPSEQITTFILNFDLFPYFDYYVAEASVTVVPPEGAVFITCDLSASLSKEGFQEKLRSTKEGFSHTDLDLPSETMQTRYSYNPLWLSFRPTLWVWVIAVIGCATLAFWKRPKTSILTKNPAPKSSIALSSNRINAFA